jgi:hypothetical protein
VERVTDTPQTAKSDAGLPYPPKGSRWRWATSRRALVGGGLLAVTLGLGSTTAGASGPPSTSGQHGTPPSGMGRLTAGGKVTALSGDTITIEARDKSTETVTFTSATTFRTMSGSSRASALKVGDFIGVEGTKHSNGSVTATSVMIGSGPPGHIGRGGPDHKGAPTG